MVLLIKIIKIVNYPPFIEDRVFLPVLDKTYKNKNKIKTYKKSL